MLQLSLAGEFVLLEDLKRVGGEDLAAAVTKVRAGEVEIVAGFDGRYGTVHPVRSTRYVDKLPACPAGFDRSV